MDLNSKMVAAAIRNFPAGSGIEHEIQTGLNVMLGFSTGIHIDSNVAVIIYWLLRIKKGNLLESRTFMDLVFSHPNF